MRARRIIEWGGATVIIRPRDDGRWVVYWREAGRGRQTTAQSEADAESVAKAKAKTLAAGQGGKLVTLQEFEILDRLKAAAGVRSPLLLIEEIEEAVARLGSGGLAKAIAHYEASGLVNIQEASLESAKERFMGLYRDSGQATRTSFRKQLERLCRAHPGAAVADITQQDLDALLVDLSPKTHNIRLGWMRTFFSRCRDWNFLPPGNHAADLVQKKKLPDKVPPILTPNQAAESLRVLPKYLIPTFVIGCWMGPRPNAELLGVEWEMFDWGSKYLHIHWRIAKKTMRERFVPIPDNVVELLKPWREAKGKVSGKDHIAQISKRLREAGIIPKWSPDVMRHSYISYQIALGHSYGQVAEWAGNSEAKIRADYRRPLRKEDGEAWATVGT